MKVRRGSNVEPTIVFSVMQPFSGTTPKSADSSTAGVHPKSGNEEERHGCASDMPSLLHVGQIATIPSRVTDVIYTPYYYGRT